ncbi:MAG: hypothetical protein A3F46_09225 [Legionellales bacterium RIFCSPHIGHO2_12_FULL_42_9]|nr:MAG: hypothetical protein A3F46_09225 [Legionellales bacterium RIFCSPHIGHO2_12_FULL_42_9]
MELSIIVLCLLSERYLTHKISYQRFSWFNEYVKVISSHLPSQSFWANPVVVIAVIMLPILLIVGLVFFVLQMVLFGIFTFFLQLAIFFYCLGPNNPFYPINDENYFTIVNNQLFAVIFWYIALGPMAVLFYRLASLSQHYSTVEHVAKRLVDILDWIPARVTALFYLLAGDFQNGFGCWLKMSLAAPQDNSILLSQVGACAAGGKLESSSIDVNKISLPEAQHLVEYTAIIYLLFLAMLTIVSWL